MKSDFVRREAERLSDGYLIERLKLRWHPGLSVIAFESNGGVERLHRRVGQEWKFIFGDDSIRRRNSFKRLLVTARDRDIAGRAHEFFEFRPQLRAVRAVNA